MVLRMNSGFPFYGDFPRALIMSAPGDMACACAVVVMEKNRMSGEKLHIAPLLSLCSTMYIVYVLKESFYC